MSPAQLIGRLGGSQPTLFRSAKSQRENIVALGAKRNRKLAALRKIRSLDPEIPLFIISGEGEIFLFGHLFALYPNSYVCILNSATLRPQFYPGIPFFLDDMRPQGFLGKTFSHKHSDLKLPPRVLDWNNDDILEAIARRGEDLIGNILVGTESFERYQAHRQQKLEAIDASRPEKHYTKLAEAAVAGDPPGSSAGGEHPKFGATILHNKSIRKVLVKFSPTGNLFVSKRWHDLLVCESLALEILREHKISAVESRIVEGGGRTFLETVRFDRVGADGRVGVISLSALENEWTGHGENWAVSAGLLAQQQKISKQDLLTIQIVECFGRLIANTDRHPGNLSFFWQPGDHQASLAPIYDMLPMLYAPGSDGKEIERTFKLPTYDHTLLEAWKLTLPIAMEYWDKAKKEPRLSKGFRKIAEKNLKVLRQKI